MSWQLAIVPLVLLGALVAGYIRKHLNARCASQLRGKGQIECAIRLRADPGKEIRAGWRHGVAIPHAARLDFFPAVARYSRLRRKDPQVIAVVSVDNVDVHPQGKDIWSLNRSLRVVQVYNGVGKFELAARSTDLFFLRQTLFPDED